MQQEIYIHNERVKLLANSLDRASTALVTVGVVTPLVAFFYGNVDKLTIEIWKVAVITYAFLLTALNLHLAARVVLGRLKKA